MMARGVLRGLVVLEVMGWACGLAPGERTRRWAVQQGVGVATWPLIAGAAEEAAAPPPPAGGSTTTTTLFDLEVPLRGKDVKLEKFRGKAHLVTNIKMDDPTAGANFAALRYAASNLGPSGLRVWAFPTDQGYFEPDVAELVRAKAYQQFGFGQYPIATVFDKIDVVGRTQHPLFRFLTSTPNPNGLSRLSLNFEKFLLDDNGNVLRRYPRKMTAFDFEDDLKAALLPDHALPDASPEFLTAWRDAQREAQRGEYSFRENYNVYDQSTTSSDWTGLADLSFQ